MARSRSGSAVLVAAALCVTGCGDSHEAVARDMLTAQKELRAILETVTDDASATAAAPQLAALADRIRVLRKRSDALGPAPREVATSLRTRYGQEFRDTKDAVDQHLARIGPLRAQRFQESLNRITAARDN